MSTQTDQAERDSCEAEMSALVVEAGIVDGFVRAGEGRPFPPTDGSETTDEYFDAEYEYTRRRTRKLFFDVPNEGLRKRLIASRRRLERQYAKQRRERLAAAVVECQRLRKSGNSIFLQLRIYAGVAVGYLLWGGSLGATVGGLVGALWFMAAHETLKTELAAARVEELDALKAIADDRKVPDFFTKSEEDTGMKEPFNETV